MTQPPKAAPVQDRDTRASVLRAILAELPWPVDLSAERLLDHIEIRDF
ncbi:hypothetical protein HJ526_03055 [Donghicola sp. C2-DW-16]|uniref:Uncharacterized protein n=1 Tax=Donghicola mangrovi TaxID=2729614 RepID=A0A850Q7S1_9RHOB|nr:hypothetical protein [Donghicola mangrovi]NVO22021.1 hypothetical protein [Donghicola mangrovi]NVO26388.1 hypothetical protein [Donghicola mangrovi]